MADTEDVAKALFQIVTGWEYSERQWMDDLSPKELVTFLELLADMYRIGIEDMGKVREAYKQYLEA